MELLVGTGGWDYFPATAGDRLKAYSKAFNFVEVNSTFYSLPRIATVRSWRRRVPADFVFSVKCNGLATHVHGLKPIDETFRVLRTMNMVCKLLRSDMLVIQTSFRVEIDEEKIREVSKTMSIVKDENVDVFWEARAIADSKKNPELQTEMLENGIYPIIDLSRTNPPRDADQIYSRLFSPGALEYSDEVIKHIGKKVKGSKAKRIVLSFHGVNMYKDAAKYLEK